MSRGFEEVIDPVARSDAKVLITGECGVGKEHVARLIHDRSRRCQAALETIYCAELSGTPLESELFGHVKGSFTGAYHDKPGKLETANHGTLFLDEIGDMSLRMQGLLLRFLETGEIQRVGSERTTSVDVRIITATDRHLLVDRVAADKFREDLFWRMSVIHLAIPPLRQRREDIPVLLEHFLRQFSESHRVDMPRIDEEAATLLVAADWPGNVRQLRDVVERLVVQARTGVITTADLPREILLSAAISNAEIHPSTNAVG